MTVQFVPVAVSTCVIALRGGCYRHRLLLYKADKGSPVLTSAEFALQRRRSEEEEAARGLQSMKDMLEAE
eukprot:1946496-Rhodomonas_salina.1